MNAYLVTAVLPPGRTYLDMQRVMGLHADWYRFQANGWIVVTALSAQAISTALKDVVRPTGSILVAPVRLADLRGWMPEDFWSWIYAHQVR